MSKFLNFALPTAGGLALALGVGYGLDSRNHGKQEITALETQLSGLKEKSATAQEEAEASAAKVLTLEQQIAQVQAEAAALATLPKATNAAAPVHDGALGLGRTALAAEIAAWDVDVLPDGRGLPEGSGNAFDGEEIFAEKCAACHGDFAEGVDNWPVLAGGFDTLADKDPVKTVGSYWPHLSTVWDYVNRSMPFGEAGTLTPDETYAIVAYILYSNDLIDDEFELTHENLGAFEMHNKDGFIVDDRPDTEYSQWRTEPCMENCKDEVAITMRSVFLVETPREGGTESTMNHASIDGLPTFSAAGPSFIPAADPKPAEEPTEEAEIQETAATDDAAQLAAAGEKVFKKCKACHQIGSGAKNRSGPQLNGLIGRTMGSIDGFKYSNAFKKAQEDARIWDEAALAEFLTKPKDYIKGTKMSFSGLKKETDVAALIAYLKSAGE